MIEMFGALLVLAGAFCSMLFGIQMALSPGDSKWLNKTLIVFFEASACTIGGLYLLVFVE